MTLLRQAYMLNTQLLYKWYLILAVTFIFLRFKVGFEFIRPDKLDASSKIAGLSGIVVPANSSIDYQLSFFAYKENAFNFKVC